MKKKIIVVIISVLLVLTGIVIGINFNNNQNNSRDAKVYDIGAKFTNNIINGKVQEVYEGLPSEYKKSTTLAEFESLTKKFVDKNNLPTESFFYKERGGTYVLTQNFSNSKNESIGKITVSLIKSNNNKDYSVSDIITGM